MNARSEIPGRVYVGGARFETAEGRRLCEDLEREENWKRWGPYLSERQWGTVREDYSAYGDVWNAFPHDHARSRAYRWGEDGLLGFTDRRCRMCFALALWNERDPILKERLFGLTGPQGNHGEDVKECYYYVDSTPTHSFMQAVYKYPQAAFPYDTLVRENAARGRHEPEFELVDTGVFEEGRYFDILAEYAKASPEDILIRITATNRGPEPAPLHVLPTLWFRNTWIWGARHEVPDGRPRLVRTSANRIEATHPTLGEYVWSFDTDGDVDCLFTENETNARRLWDAPNVTPHVRDAFHDRVIHGHEDAVNPEGAGTKAAPWYRLNPGPGEAVQLRLRLTAVDQSKADAFADFDDTFSSRHDDADAFYAAAIRDDLPPDGVRISRQAYAGLMWTKQFYHFITEDWLEGDAKQPPPPESRKRGRNHDWPHLYNHDVISMPDKWEYPWYAAWDLAFHVLPICDVDPEFAKNQLVLFLREWYMHPNGQIPAYEFAFGDVNPPVHAWACWRVYKMAAPQGERDTVFLERVFQKLLLNFTWWVNRKDHLGNHLFQGGFLGLDNIGVFDRSKPLPTGGYLEQADGTAWMGFYCLTMLAMAIELSKENPGYQDVAFKFFRHFVDIADAINDLDGCGLWDEQDGFYYDRLHANGDSLPLRVRSLVGLMPLVAVEVLEDATIEKLPDFWKRVTWFLENRHDLAAHISYLETDGRGGLRLLAVPSRERLESVLRYMLDESEFLSPYGIRSLSKYHDAHPYAFDAGGERHEVRYTPGESETGLFGGNSNWRGPIWFPINYLLIEALQRYHHFYGDGFKVEYPTGSDRRLTLAEVAVELAQRHLRLFQHEGDVRPASRGFPYATDPHWRDLLVFHEYFHGETGKGLGASHQTGWTALIARLIDKFHPGQP